MVGIGTVDDWAKVLYQRLERLALFRQIDVADVEYVPHVADSGVGCAPLVPDDSRSHIAVVFRTTLTRQTGFDKGCSKAFATRFVLDEGEEKLWKIDTKLGSIFLVIVVDEFLNISAQCLVTAFQMGRERLRPMKDVAMLIGGSQGKAQISSSIGTVDFELYSMVRQRRQLDEAIEFLTITRYRLHTHIDISQDVQTTERSIGVSNSSFGIKHTR